MGNAQDQRINVTYTLRTSQKKEMRRRFLPGLNVQTPWARLLISGKKTVETRFYPLPRKYVGKEMAIVETPGKSGAFRSRVIGIVVFGESFVYQNRKQFESDAVRHLVPPKSKFGWNDARGRKWGWPLSHVQAFVTPQSCDGRGGVVYWRRVVVPNKSPQLRIPTKMKP